MRIKQRSAVPFVRYNSIGVGLCPTDVITLELGERGKPVNPSARIKNNNNNNHKKGSTKLRGDSVRDGNLGLSLRTN